MILLPGPFHVERRVSPLTNAPTISEPLDMAAYSENALEVLENETDKHELGLVFQ